MKIAVIEAGRHGPVQLIHESLEVYLRTSHHVLRPHIHTVPKRCEFRMHIGYAVNVHQAVGRLPVQAVKTPRPMVLYTPGKDPNPTGIKPCGYGVALDALACLPPVKQGEFLSRFDPQSGQSTNSMYFLFPLHSLQCWFACLAKS